MTEAEINEVVLRVPLSVSVYLFITDREIYFLAARDLSLFCAEKILSKQKVQENNSDPSQNNIILAVFMRMGFS